MLCSRINRSSFSCLTFGVNFAFFVYCGLVALTLCSSSSLLQVWHLRCRMQEFAKGRCEQLVGLLKDFLFAPPKDRSSLSLVLLILRRTKTFAYRDITLKRNNLAQILPLDQCMFESRNSFSMVSEATTVSPCLLSMLALKANPGGLGRTSKDEHLISVVPVSGRRPAENERGPVWLALIAVALHSFKLQELQATTATWVSSNGLSLFCHCLVPFLQFLQWYTCQASTRSENAT